MKTKVITLDNKSSGEISLNKSVFGLEERKDIIQRVVRWQLAKKQSGNHKTKGVSEISGTTAKPFKQKGTGRARQGTARAAQMRGGATIFGPVVRSHSHNLPKKIRSLGLKCALSSKVGSGDLILVKDINISNSKTSDLVSKLKGLDISSALFIGGVEVNADFKKASSNIKGIHSLPVVGANVYDILKYKKLVLTEEAVKLLEEKLA